MATHLEHVASHIIGRPLLILPQKLGVIANVLAGRIGVDVEAPELGLDLEPRPEPLSSRFVGKRYDADTNRGLPYGRTEDGTAIITITGSLVNRGAWIGASSGLTSYEGIAAQIRAAMADPKVTSIVLDLHTPGGEATGAFELAELVGAANQTKPITAFVNGVAASAGYMIASGAGKIVSVPSGITGSIGVVMMHADISRKLDQAGVTVNLIHSGKHKVEGNPYKPLDDSTKARLQAEVDGMREEFVQLVAKGRGRKLSAKAARDTEAGVFTGKEALAAGLVDELASFDTLYSSMNRSAASGRPASTRRASMNYTQADLDQARADGKAEGITIGKAEGFAEGEKSGMAKGAAGERTRIQGIMNSPEAKGREGLAAHFAYGTESSLETAEAALKASAKSSGLAERAAESDRGFHTAGIDVQPKKATVIDASAIYAEHNKKLA